MIDDSVTCTDAAWPTDEARARHLLRCDDAPETEVTSRRGDCDDRRWLEVGWATIGEVAGTPLSVGVVGEAGCLDCVTAATAVTGLWSSSSSLSVTTLMVPSLDTSDDVWLTTEARFASLRRKCSTALSRPVDVEDDGGCGGWTGSGASVTDVDEVVDV